MIDLLSLESNKNSLHLTMTTLMTPGIAVNDTSSLSLLGLISRLGLANPLSKSHAMLIRK
jgi:hypothetical protein